MNRNGFLPRFLSNLFEVESLWAINPFISGIIAPFPGQEVNVGSEVNPFQAVYARNFHNEYGPLGVNEVNSEAPIQTIWEDGIATIKLNIDSDDFDVDDDTQKLTTKDIKISGVGAISCKSTKDSDFLDEWLEAFDFDDTFPKTTAIKIKTSSLFTQSGGKLDLVRKAGGTIPFYSTTGDVLDTQSNFTFDGASLLKVPYIETGNSLQLQDYNVINKRYLSQFYQSEAGSSLDFAQESNNRRLVKLRIHNGFFKVNAQNDLEIKTTYREPLYIESDQNSSQVHIKIDNKSIRLNGQNELEFGLSPGKGLAINQNTSVLDLDIDHSLKYIGNSLSVSLEGTAPIKINDRVLSLDIDDSLSVTSDGKLSMNLLVDNQTIGWTGNKLRGLYSGSNGVTIVGDSIKGSYTGGTRITISGSTISCSTQDIEDDIAQNVDDIAQNASQLASTTLTAASGLAGSIAASAAAATGIALANSAIAGNAVTAGLVSGLSAGLAATDAALSVAQLANAAALSSGLAGVTGIQSAALATATGILQGEIAALGLSTGASIATLTAAISTLVGTTSGILVSQASTAAGLIATDSILSALGVSHGITASGLASNIAATGTLSGIVTAQGVTMGIHTANLVTIDGTLGILTSGLATASTLAATAQATGISAQGTASSALGVATGAASLSASNAAAIALIMLGSLGGKAGYQDQIDDCYGYINELQNGIFRGGNMASTQWTNDNFVKLNTAITTPKLDVTGILTVGSAGQKNMIRFFGTQSDYNNGTTSNNSCIVNRLVSGSETSELLLFSGNDISGVSGPDSIRLMASEVYVDLYAADGTYNWDTNTPPSANRKLTITQSQVTFANNVFVNSNKLATELFVTGSYQPISGMSAYYTKTQSDLLYPTLTNFNTLSSSVSALYSNAYLDTQFLLRPTNAQLDTKLADWSTKAFLTLNHFTKNESDARYMPITPGQIELGSWNSDTPAYIDFHAKVGSGDNESRIIRAGGNNGTFSIMNNAVVAISGSSITLNNIPITDYTLQSSLTTQLGSYLTTTNASSTYMLKTNTLFSTITFPATDTPMLNKPYDPFTSGKYNGLGRWGMFFEPSWLTIGGIKSTPLNRGVQIVGYNLDSTYSAWVQVFTDNGNVSLTALTDSTSHSTGAVTIAGGVGIGGKLYVGGDVYMGGNLIATQSYLTTQINTRELPLTFGTGLTRLGNTVTINASGITSVGNLTGLVVDTPNELILGRTGNTYLFLQSIPQNKIRLGGYDGTTGVYKPIYVESPLYGAALYSNGLPVMTTSPTSITINNPTTASTTLQNILAPNLTPSSSANVSVVLGVSATSYNSSYWNYCHVGNAHIDNSLNLGIYGATSSLIVKRDRLISNGNFFATGTLDVTSSTVCNGLLSVKADINCYRSIDNGHYLIHRNLSNGVSAFTAISLRNETDNGLHIFINSGNRGVDGGVNGSTIRSDIGILRLAGINNYITLNPNGSADFNSPILAPALKCGEVSLNRLPDSQGLFIGWNMSPLGGQGLSMYISNRGGGYGHHRFYIEGNGLTRTEVFNMTEGGSYVLGAKVATENWVNSNSFATQSFVTTRGYLTNNWTADAGFYSAEFGFNNLVPDSAVTTQIRLRGRPVNTNTKSGLEITAYWDGPSNGLTGPGFSLHSIDTDNHFYAMDAMYSKTVNSFQASHPAPGMIYKTGSKLKFQYRNAAFWQSGGGYFQSWTPKTAMEVDLTNGEVTVNDSMVTSGHLHLGMNGSGDRFATIAFYSSTVQGERTGTIEHSPGSGSMHYINNVNSTASIPTNYADWSGMTAPHRFFQHVSFHGACLITGSVSFTVPANSSMVYPGIGSPGSPSTSVTYNASILANNSILCRGSLLVLSDARTKKNIEELNGQWCSQALDKIKAVHYNRKSDGGEALYGFLAQNVQEVASECVKDLNDTLHLDHNQLISILWGAVKELKRKVNELNKKLNDK